jgi:hypothetical protein
MRTQSLFQPALIFMAGLHAFAVPGGPTQPHVDLSVTFYRVPLACPAAPEIGCGSKAMPVLAQIEQKKDIVAEAWLNRAGTVIGVVWKEGVSHEVRLASMRSVFQSAGMDAGMVSGPEHEGLLRSFRLKAEWYRDADVRQLSLEESRIIAERLVNRVKGRIPLPEDRAQALRAELFSALKDRISKPYAPAAYVEGSPESQTLLKTLETRLLEAGRKHLSEAELPALRKAIAIGLRPMPEDGGKAVGEKATSCCAKRS